MISDKPNIKGDVWANIWGKFLDIPNIYPTLVWSKHNTPNLGVCQGIYS